MTGTVVFVPRWGGDPTSDWLPWLRAELASAWPQVATTVVGLCPSPGAPAPAPCVAALAVALAEARRRGPVVLVGHSVGCQVALRALARHPAGSVAATLLVAPWREVDEPWSSLLPWMEPRLDVRPARPAAGQVSALVSDDDPFTADHEATARWLDEGLGGQVRCVAGARHFNAAQEPEVRAALWALLAGVLPKHER